jgi:hypothetical protein
VQLLLEWLAQEQELNLVSDILPYKRSSIPVVDCSIGIVTVPEVVTW